VALLQRPSVATSTRHVADGVRVHHCGIAASARSSIRLGAQVDRRNGALEDALARSAPFSCILETFTGTRRAGFR
jgi:hypothetical protein